MSVGFAWGRAARTERRMAKLDDVPFCACLELVGFEHYHAVRGRPYRVVVAASGSVEVATRAARLYFSDAVSVTTEGTESASSGAESVLRVAAEIIGRGRYRVVVGA